MQKDSLLRNKLGFSTILLMLLGFIFFLIAGVIAVQVQTENEQQVSTARSLSSESRLNFIAQCVQADYFNNFLQTEFESEVVNFLENGGDYNGRHLINPDSTFEQNLKSGMESYLTESAYSIMGGAAAEVYATAYDELPSISCEPLAVSGAAVGISMYVNPDGQLEVGSISVGQRMFCEDTEQSTSAEIDLRARDYVLQTRAVEIHDKAVEAINNGATQLRTAKGIYHVNPPLWALPNDDGAKSWVFQNWQTQINLLRSTFPVLEDGGLSIAPNSVSAHSNSDMNPYDINDISAFGCFGGASTAGPQTCRPDGVNLTIGVKQGSCKEHQIPLKFKDGSCTTTSSGSGSGGSSGSNAGMQVRLEIEIAGVVVPGISEIGGYIFGNLLTQLCQDSLSHGCMGYQGSTQQVCRFFEGKPSAAAISGTVLETSPDYLVSGINQISFEFISTPQDISDSTTGTRNIDCSDDQYERMKNENAVLMATNNGQNVPDIVIGNASSGGGVQINQSSLQQLADNMASSTLMAGQEVTVNVEAGVTDPNGQVTSTTSASQKSQGTGGIASYGGSASQSMSSGVPTGQAGSELTEAFSSGSYPQAANQLQSLVNAAAANSNSAGQLVNARALGTTAVSICKLMGLKNFLEMDEEQLALLALAGLVDLADNEDLRLLYSLAALYQAIDSGSVNAIVAAIGSMIGGNYVQILLAAEQVDAAIESGDPEEILKAASTVLNIAGYDEAGLYLARAASIINALESGDILEASPAILSAFGRDDLAGFMSGVNALDQALENGDTIGALSAAGDMATSLGYDGLAQIGGYVGTAAAIANTIANFDELLEQCKDEIPWDLVCLAMPESGGVCKKTMGSCPFEFALPTFNLELLCNELVSGMGFQLDCTCMYQCATYTLPVPTSVRLTIDQLLAELEIEGLDAIVAAAAIAQVAVSGDIEAFCNIDP